MESICGFWPGAVESSPCELVASQSVHIRLCDVVFRRLSPQSVAPKLSDPRRSSSGCKDNPSPSCVFRAEKEVQHDRASCSHHRRLCRSSVMKSPRGRSRLHVRFRICNDGCRSRRCLSPTSRAFPLLLSSLAWPKLHSPCASRHPECQRNTLRHWPVFVWSCSLTMVPPTRLDEFNMRILYEGLRHVKEELCRLELIFVMMKQLASRVASLTLCGQTREYEMNSHSPNL
jgi:hypothetical protein